MHVAEQVSIERPPEVVVGLLSQRPATWLQPFLLLAWNEGEAALRRLGQLPAAAAAAACAPAMAGTAAAAVGRGAAGRPLADEQPGSAGAATARRADHHLRLGEPMPRNGGGTSFAVLWTAGSAEALFRRLRGELAVEPFEGGAVLGLRGTCVSQGDTGLVGTAQRPVELVVRSLLGHIRTAVE